MTEVMRAISTSGFEETYFAALGNGVGLLVLVRTHAKVLDSLTSVPLAS